jgi:hypothetical protein
LANLKRFFTDWINVTVEWKWVMWFGALVQAFANIILYFFMEEAMYVCDTVEGIDSRESSNGTSTPIKVGNSAPDTEKNEKPAVLTTLEGSNTALTP